jgi:hypothetical protein
MATKVDLEQLTKELPFIKPGMKLYVILKRGLKPIHHWKDLPRGKHNKPHK